MNAELGRMIAIFRAAGENSQNGKSPYRGVKRAVTALGNPIGMTYRARRQLNDDTIAELHKAFRRGGAQAINKVMRNNPAMFLKLLVLLVPREMEVQHSGSIKAMTDEQLERSI